MPFPVKTYASIMMFFFRRVSSDRHLGAPVRSSLMTGFVQCLCWPRIDIAHSPHHQRDAHARRLGVIIDADVVGFCLFTVSSRLIRGLRLSFGFRRRHCFQESAKLSLLVQCFSPNRLLTETPRNGYLFVVSLVKFRYVLGVFELISSLFVVERYLNTRRA